MTGDGSMLDRGQAYNFRALLFVAATLVSCGGDSTGDDIVADGSFPDHGIDIPVAQDPGAVQTDTVGADDSLDAVDMRDSADTPDAAEDVSCFGDVFYRDKDGDKYGVHDEFVIVCPGDNVPEGYIVEKAGGWDCNDNDPEMHPLADEICDGKDNDCDGKPDNVPTEVCFIENEHGSCTGKSSCTGQEMVCYAPTPAPEQCDGKDNDCNGATDDGLTLEQQCGVTDIGECSMGTEKMYCENGAWTDWYDCTAVFPVDEDCNGKDDDCNGDTDETSPLSGQPCDGPDEDLCETGVLECAPDGTGVICVGDDGDPCADKECGDDGCGGSCGECGPGYECSPSTHKCFCPSMVECAGVCCEDGETCESGVCSSGTLYPDGSYALDKQVFYTCSYGLVDFSFSTLQFADNGSNLVVAIDMISCCQMTGPSAEDGDINVTCTCPGGGMGCTEVYSLNGSFTDNDTWQATFTASFSGGMCLDCVYQSWNLTGTKQ